MHLTTKAHEIAAQVIQPGDVAIDATAGNGYDTVFLANKVGSEGHVYSFDIQPKALEATLVRLAGESPDLSPRVSQINACHSTLSSHIAKLHLGRISCVMFNLGYLPGGDHCFTTHTDTTIAAITEAQRLLLPGGLLSVLAYPGHEGGRAEVHAVEQLATESENAQWQEIGGDQGSIVSPRLFVFRKSE